ncbi:MAG: LacI family transcriptional regulator, partial [Lachnospiraceae bacterium]|nr:LacI family transcriptional regulator [Lachnospiraceae bacterium]
MPATIVDIKEKTGLSLATISKYLNGGNVLPENKTKIEAAIKELHYEVNELARGLVTNRTSTVGILVYSIESPFSGMILHHVGLALRKEGYGMLIVDSCNDEKIESKNLKYVLSKKVDGIIVLPVAKSGDFLIPAKDAGVPVVLLDRALSDAQYDCVRINNRQSTC